MQEPMNSIMHQWSHSWYRSRYCPSSIVQDGGDTAINGTVPIYFRASPDLCHHVGRGINPRGRAVTPSHHCLCASLRLSSHPAHDSCIIASCNNTDSSQSVASVSLLPVALQPTISASSRSSGMFFG